MGTFFALCLSKSGRKESIEQASIFFRKTAPSITTLSIEEIMQDTKLLFAFDILFACGRSGFAQSVKSSERPTVSELEDRFTGLVERSFADPVKHVVASNYGMAATIRQEKLPEKLDSDSELNSIVTKADIMKCLKDSFAYPHKAINEKNETDLIQSPDNEKPSSRLEVADRPLWHSWNHYEQMVEYLQMNTIVPPSSRQ
jgi:hypothetical protein